MPAVLRVYIGGTCVSVDKRGREHTLLREQSFRRLAFSPPLPSSSHPKEYCLFSKSLTPSSPWLQHRKNRQRVDRASQVRKGFRNISRRAGGKQRACPELVDLDLSRYVAEMRDRKFGGGRLLS